MTQFSEEYRQRYGLGGWDATGPQSKCQMCHGTGRAGGHTDDPNPCGFCEPDEAVD